MSYRRDGARNEEADMGRSQGGTGSMNELTLGWIKERYGGFLMEGETAITGFERSRDCIIFTDKRIVNVSHRGMAGKKLRVTSIYLSQIVGVALDAASGHIGNHKLRICYVTSLYRKTAVGIKTAELHYEFPNKFDCCPFYKRLQRIALENYENLNR